MVQPERKQRNSFVKGVKMVKSRVTRSSSYSARQQRNSFSESESESELKASSSHSLPMMLGFDSDSDDDKETSSRRKSLPKRVASTGSKKTKDDNKKKKKDNDTKKKKKKRSSKQSATLYAALDMVTPKYVLQQLEQIRQDDGVVKLDIQDLIVSGNEQSEDLLVQLSQFFFAGDRQWQSISFADAVSLGDLKKWLRSNREAMDFFEDLFREQPGMLGFETLTFQAKVEVEEGFRVSAFCGLLRNIKRQRRVASVKMIVDSSELDEESLGEFLEEGNEDTGLQDTLSVLVTFSWMPDPDGLALLEACLRMVRDLGDPGSARSNESGPGIRRVKTDPSAASSAAVAPLKRSSTADVTSKNNEWPREDCNDTDNENWSQDQPKAAAAPRRRLREHQRNSIKGLRASVRASNPERQSRHNRRTVTPPNRRRSGSNVLSQATKSEASRPRPSESKPRGTTRASTSKLNPMIKPRKPKVVTSLFESQSSDSDSDSSASSNHSSDISDSESTFCGDNTQLDISIDESYRPKLTVENDNQKMNGSGFGARRSIRGLKSFDESVVPRRGLMGKSASSSHLLGKLGANQSAFRANAGPVRERVSKSTHARRSIKDIKLGLDDAAPSLVPRRGVERSASASNVLGMLAGGSKPKLNPSRSFRRGRRSVKDLSLAPASRSALLTKSSSTSNIFGKLHWDGGADKNNEGEGPSPQEMRMARELASLETGVQELVRTLSNSAQKARELSSHQSGVPQLARTLSNSSINASASSLSQGTASTKSTAASTSNSSETAGLKSTGVPSRKSTKVTRVAPVDADESTSKDKTKRRQSNRRSIRGMRTVDKSDKMTTSSRRGARSSREETEVAKAPKATSDRRRVRRVLSESSADDGASSKDKVKRTSQASRKGKRGSVGIGSSETPKMLMSTTSKGHAEPNTLQHPGVKASLPADKLRTLERSLSSSMLGLMDDSSANTDTRSDKRVKETGRKAAQSTDGVLAVLNSSFSTMSWNVKSEVDDKQVEGENTGEESMTSEHERSEVDDGEREKEEEQENGADKAVEKDGDQKEETCGGDAVAEKEASVEKEEDPADPVDNNQEGDYGEKQDASEEKSNTTDVDSVASGHEEQTEGTARQSDSEASSDDESVTDEDEPESAEEANNKEISAGSEAPLLVTKVLANSSKRETSDGLVGRFHDLAGSPCAA